MIDHHRVERLTPLRAGLARHTRRWVLGSLVAVVAATTIGAGAEARAAPLGCGSSATCDWLQGPHSRLQTSSDFDLGDASSSASNPAINAIARGIKLMAGLTGAHLATTCLTHTCSRSWAGRAIGLLLCGYGAAPVTSGKVGSAPHSVIEPSYKAMFSCPRSVNRSAVWLAAMPPPQYVMTRSLSRAPASAKRWRSSSAGTNRVSPAMSTTSRTAR